MADRKPAMLWAVVSLVSSALGCLAFLALMLLGGLYHDMANSSAGVGGIWPGIHATAATALCLVGVLSGAIALLRIHFGAYRGLGMAWTGIVVGCLPWSLSIVFARLWP